MRRTDGRLLKIGLTPYLLKHVLEQKKLIVQHVGGDGLVDSRKACGHGYMNSHRYCSHGRVGLHD